MPITITVIDSELDGFSPQAVSDLTASLTKYKVDLLREVGRIEAGQNGGSGNPEITSRMITDAELVFSRGKAFKKRKSATVLLRILGIITLFIAGLMADRESLKDFTFLICFIVVVIVAVVVNTALVLRES